MTVVFGAATILLLPLLLDRHRPARRSPRRAADGALAGDGLLLADVHPGIAVRLLHAGVRRSRVGRVATDGGRGVAGCWPALPAGLAAATKETSVIVLPAALAGVRRGLVVAGIGAAAQRAADGAGARPRSSVVAVAARDRGAVLLVVLHAPGSASSSRSAAPAPTSHRGIDPASHGHPWHYYLRLLTYASSGGLRWSEGLVLVLAAVGAADGVAPAGPARPEAASGRATSRRRRASLARSSRPSPTRRRGTSCRSTRRDSRSPDRVLGARRDRRARARCAPCSPARSAIASAQLGWQAWRAAVTYAADPRNPYVYAQTVPDAVRMAARIRELAALHPDGERACRSRWSRRRTSSGRCRGICGRCRTSATGWKPGPARLGAPVIVASMGNADHARRRPRRSLCLGVLRPQAESPHALRRTRAVGPFPGPLALGGHERNGILRASASPATMLARDIPTSWRRFEDGQREDASRCFRADNSSAP